MFFKKIQLANNRLQNSHLVGHSSFFILKLLYDNQSYKSRAGSRMI